MKKISFLLLLFFQLQIYVIGADDSSDDFALKEEKVTLFASKRSGEDFNPDKSKLDIQKSLKDDVSLLELNLFTYDSIQGKFIPVVNDIKVKKNSSFGISFEEVSLKKNIHLYAYAIDQWGSVIQLFPSKKPVDLNDKNPIQKGFKYLLPSEKTGKWFPFGGKGKYHIFVFVTKDKYQKLENVKKRDELGETVKKFKQDEKDTFAVTVKDQFNISRGKEKGILYSNIVGFKNLYAEYFQVFVE